MKRHVFCFFFLFQKRINFFSRSIVYLVALTSLNHIVLYAIEESVECLTVMNIVWMWMLDTVSVAKRIWLNYKKCIEFLWNMMFENACPKTRLENVLFHNRNANQLSGQRFHNSKACGCGIFAAQNGFQHIQKLKSSKKVHIIHEFDERTYTRTFFFHESVVSIVGLTTILLST